jgi:hypothetical protein
VEARTAKLANEIGLDIVVSHVPPGTSKWNKIEHRLFSFISQNWRAKPLVSFKVIAVSATTITMSKATRCLGLPSRSPREDGPILVVD